MEITYNSIFCSASLAVLFSYRPCFVLCLYWCFWTFDVLTCQLLSTHYNLSTHISHLAWFHDISTNLTMSEEPPPTLSPIFTIKSGIRKQSPFPYGFTKGWSPKMHNHASFVVTSSPHPSWDCQASRGHRKSCCSTVLYAIQFPKPHRSCLQMPSS